MFKPITHITKYGKQIVRRVIPSDYPEFSRLVESQKIPMESRGLNLQDYAQVFTKLNDSNFLYLGAFDEYDNMLSCNGVFFWNSLPFCTNQGLIVDGTKRIPFHPLRSGLISIFESMYNYCESKKYYTHYSVRYAKTFDTELAVWDKHCDISHKYIRSREEYVPKNTIPKWSAHWNVMEQHTYPYDAIIHCVRLNQQYRGKL